MMGPLGLEAPPPTEKVRLGLVAPAGLVMVMKETPPLPPVKGGLKGTTLPTGLEGVPVTAWTPVRVTLVLNVIVGGAPMVMVRAPPGRPGLERMRLGLTVMV